jgi:hypothetical protein
MKDGRWEMGDRSNGIKIYALTHLLPAPCLVSLYRRGTRRARAAAPRSTLFKDIPKNTPNSPLTNSVATKFGEFFEEFAFFGINFGRNIDLEGK